MSMANLAVIEVQNKRDRDEMIMFPWTSMKVAGVLDEYQGCGIAALLFVELAKAALPRGFRMIDLSLQAENSEKLTTLVTHFGAEDYKRYRVYKMPLKTLWQAWHLGETATEAERIWLLPPLISMALCIADTSSKASPGTTGSIA